MAESIWIDGVPYSFEADAEAGAFLIGDHAGELWTGTRLRWRPGTAGPWRRVLLYDVHPLDGPAVRAALEHVVRTSERGR